MTKHPSEPELSATPAEELISELATGVEVIDAGRFTIDPAQARRKLREHQLAEAHAYVLLLVEVAHLAGDSPEQREIEFRLGAPTRATFRAPTRSTEVLAELFASVFSNDGGEEGDSRQRALRLLALALNAMLSVEAAEVSVEHIDGEGAGQRIRFDAQGLATVEAAEELEPEQLGGAHLLRPGEMRVVLEGGVLDSLGRAQREKLLLEDRCRYASAVVRVDGRRVSHGLSAALDDPSEALLDTRERVVLEDGREIGLAGRRVRERAPELLLVVRGVLTHALPPPDSSSGLLAIVELDELRKDLSQRKVLRDTQLDALEAAVLRSDAALPPCPPPPEQPAASQGYAPKSNLAGCLILLGVLALFSVPVVVLLLASGKSSRTSTPSSEALESASSELDVVCKEGDYMACIEHGHEMRAQGDVWRAICAFGPACHTGGFSAGCFGLARALVANGEPGRAQELLYDRCEGGDAGACELRDSDEFRVHVPLEGPGLHELRAMRTGLRRDVAEGRVHHRVRVENGLRKLLFVDESGAEWAVDAVASGYDDRPALAHTRAMLLAQLMRPGANRALVFGIGNASLLRFLRRFYPQLALEVVAPARKLKNTSVETFGLFHAPMFELDEREPEQGVLADPQPRYELIYLPAFFERSRSREQGTPAPLTPAQLRPLLRPGGMLVFDSEAGEGLELALEAARASFARVHAFDAGERVVILASTADEQVSRDSLRIRAAMLREVSGLDLEGFLDHHLD